MPHIYVAAAAALAVITVLFLVLVAARKKPAEQFRYRRRGGRLAGRAHRPRYFYKGTIWTDTHAGRLLRGGNPGFNEAGISDNAWQWCRCPAGPTGPPLADRLCRCTSTTFLR